MPKSKTAARAPRAPKTKPTPGRGRPKETDPKVAMGLSVLQSEKDAIDAIAASLQVSRSALFEERIQEILRTRK